MTRFLKRKLGKKGFVSIEAIIAISSALMVILVGIGFFTLMFPRIMLQQETHQLAQKAKIQGGLTTPETELVDSDLSLFLDRLEDIGYERDDVVVSVVTTPGNIDALGVTPLHEDGSDYVSRDSEEIMHIRVEVPANISINAPLSFFGSSKAENTYRVMETVMSERW